jgi:hypothetical protein
LWRAVNYSRQRKRKQRSAGRDHDVLPAIQRVCHW